MPKNMYDGVDPDAVSFIDRKAKDLTHSSFFTSADFKDLQQELTLAFLHAWPKFDPSKGDRLSFIKAVVNNCARNLKIIAKAKKRWMGQGLLSLSEVGLEGEESLTLADMVANEEGLWGDASLEFHQLSSELRHDVERVIATLPSDLARICHLLNTKTIAEISVETGVPRSTIQDAVKRLRKLMETAGLKIYLS